MNTSESTNEIAPALVAAISKMRNPRTDSKARVTTKQGGSYEYAYLSLPALCEYVRETLAKTGLIFTQEIIDVDGGTGCNTRFWHLSGQWIEMGPLVLRGGPAAQDQGSLQTYAKRYALAAAVGLAADEDDDGKRAHESSGPAVKASSGSAGPARPAAGEGGAGGVLGKDPVGSDLASEVVALFGNKNRVLAAARMIEEVTTFDSISEDTLRELRERKHDLDGR